MYSCECGREFKTEQHYNMHKVYCKGPRYCQNPDCNKLLLKLDQKKFCSTRCSAIVTGKGRKVSEETRNKISQSLGGTGKILLRKFCLNCGKLINNPKFCNLQCSYEYRYKTNVKNWLEDPGKHTSPKGFMKKWLIDQKGEECHRCGWKEVNKYTHKIPLEMHHKDGNWRNNNPENLDLICPNCHSLTSTYRYGNKGNGRTQQREYYRGKTSKKDLPVAKLDKQQTSNL